MKKTITLGSDDNPTVSLIRGHVTATEFNRAHRAEGWRGDWIYKNMLRHEWWTLSRPCSKKISRLLPRGGEIWERSEKGAPGAIAVTVSYW